MDPSGTPEGRESDEQYLLVRGQAWCRHRHLAVGCPGAPRQGPGGGVVAAPDPRCHPHLAKPRPPRPSGGRARRARWARAAGPDSLEQALRLRRSWPTRAMAALTRVMRLPGGWRRGGSGGGSGVRPSRSSQTTPLDADLAVGVEDVLRPPAIAAVALASASSLQPSAAYSDIVAVSPTVESPCPSSSSSASPSASLGRASYLEALVRCTSLDQLGPWPVDDPGGPAPSVLAQDGDDGTSLPAGLTRHDGEDEVAEAPPTVEPLLEVPETEAEAESPAPPEAPPTPASAAAAPTTTTSPTDVGQPPAGEQPPRTVLSTEGDALAANVRDVADLLRALDEVGERIPPVQDGLGHDAVLEHADHSTVAGRGRSKDPSLLMLALRQDGDQSVLLLTLLDTACAAEARQLGRLVRDCKTNMAVITAAVRDVNVEAARDVSVEAVGDVPVEASKDVPVEASKDVSVEAAKDVPAEASKDDSVEAAKDVPAEASKDVSVEAAEDVPAEASKDVSVEAAKDVPASCPVGPDRRPGTPPPAPPPRRQPKPAAAAAGQGPRGSLGDLEEPGARAALAGGGALASDVGDQYLAAYAKCRCASPPPPSASLEDAKRRVLSQSRTCELGRPPRPSAPSKPRGTVAAAAVSSAASPRYRRPPRAAPEPDQAPAVRARYARRGPGTSASRMGSGVGLAEEEECRARPRGCRLPSLQAVSPHRVPRPARAAPHRAAVGKQITKSSPSRTTMQRVAPTPPPGLKLPTRPAAAAAAAAAPEAADPGAPGAPRRKTLSVSFKEPQC